MKTLKVAPNLITYEAPIIRDASPEHLRFSWGPVADQAEFRSERVRLDVVVEDDEGRWRVGFCDSRNVWIKSEITE